MTACLLQKARSRHSLRFTITFEFVRKVCGKLWFPVCFLWRTAYKWIELSYAHVNMSTRLKSCDVTVMSRRPGVHLYITAARREASQSQLLMPTWMRSRRGVQNHGAFEHLHFQSKSADEDCVTRLKASEKRVSRSWVEICFCQLLFPKSRINSECWRHFKR